MPFEDILGQDPPVAFLKALLAQERLSGSCLFAGPEGVGKALSGGLFPDRFHGTDSARLRANVGPYCAADLRREARGFRRSAAEGFRRLRFLRQPSKPSFPEPGREASCPESFGDFRARLFH